MSYYDKSVPFEDLKGQVFSDIQRSEDELIFVTEDGEQYKMLHLQDCCEAVYIEGICGDLDDLIGSEILRAEEVIHADKHPDEVKAHLDARDFSWGSFTWTFYKLSTIKGDVTIRWLGESNGYYSESVELTKE